MYDPQVDVEFEKAVEFASALLAPYVRMGIFNKSFEQAISVSRNVRTHFAAIESVNNIKVIPEYLRERASHLLHAATPDCINEHLLDWINGPVADELPSDQREYLRALFCSQEALGPNRKKGALKLDARNKAIRSVVEAVAWKFDLDPTSNAATKEKGHVKSACSVVRKALERLDIFSIKESAVEKIYSRTDSLAEQCAELGLSWPGWRKSARHS
jgi:hypothetical protein